MDEKIIQILPAPAGLEANYNVHDPGSDLNPVERGAFFTRPVTCLALVEITDGYETRSEVRVMRPAHEGDILEFAQASDRFISLTHKQPDLQNVWAQCVLGGGGNAQ